MLNRNLAAILLAGTLTLGTAPLAFPLTASTGSDNVQQPTPRLVSKSNRQRALSRSKDDITVISMAE
jgi:hypothetical protein